MITRYTNLAAYSRIVAGVIAAVDESIAKVVGALHEKLMLSNSIILFISDNGGAPEDSGDKFQNFGSNWPLRGVSGMRQVGTSSSLSLLKNTSNRTYTDERFSDRRRSALCSHFMESVDKVTKLRFKRIGTFD